MDFVLVICIFTDLVGFAFGSGFVLGLDDIRKIGRMTQNHSSFVEENDGLVAHDTAWWHQPPDLQDSSHWDSMSQFEYDSR